MFHLVSLSFANFPGSGVVVWCLLGCVLGFGFLVVFCSLPGKLLHPISFQFPLEFPVVDRPCLVLARQWLLAPDSLTGLAVFAMRMLCRCGSLPTGPLWYCTSCNTRRMSTELPTHLGWTRRLLRMDDIQTQWQEARANRRMQFKVGDYKDTPSKRIGYSCLSRGIQPRFLH